ncbi:hypothetical protein QBC44DRAFT_388128 [Cladorrhinum sp. PSN332]|nr:hypothetical protein QBC44DRAFT_388128 [Cladorrhinum sp. PSN332]
MTVNSKKAPKAWDHGRRDPTSLAFHLKCYMYCTHGEEQNTTQLIRSYLSQGIPESSFKIEVDTSLQGDAQSEVSEIVTKDAGERVFVELKLLCTVPPQTAVTTEADCIGLAHELGKFLRDELSAETNEYKSIVGADKLVIAWSIDPNWGHSTRLSRYRGGKVDPSPVGQIESAMSRLLNLSSQGAWQRSTAHDNCGSGSVLNCVNHLLTDLKTTRKNLDNIHSSLQAAEKNGTFETTIQTSINALVAMNQSTLALICLLDEHVGRKPSNLIPGGGWGIGLIRILYRLFTSKYLTVPMNDPSFNSVKQNAKMESSHFAALAKNVAAHIRLHDPNVMSCFQKAVSSAPTLKEKEELPGKLGLWGNKIGDRAMHLGALAKTCDQYTFSVDLFIKEVDEMIQLARDFSFLDKKGQAKSGMARKRATKKGWQMCDVELKKMEAKQREFDRSRGVDSDSDSDSDPESNCDWNEKA